MKCVILAGGLGTRISEESHLRPKPMIEVGGLPILWHIMKIYGAQGICEFVICCGYKGYLIKEYFANYFLHMSDVTFDMSNNKMEVHHQHAEPWKVTLVDTGEKTQTGGRIKRVREYLNDTFCMTYGDGVSDIDITQLIAFHKKQQTFATVTAVRPTGRFGTISISGDRVKSFKEKPMTDGRWISGGFFVCEPEVINFIDNDDSVFEQAPLGRLVADDQLSVWKHKGFWSTMDTLRERQLLGGTLAERNGSLESLVVVEFWKKRKVLITGHTGFKGSWLLLFLQNLGAEVFGYALNTDTNPALFKEAELSDYCHHAIGDVRDYSSMQKRVLSVKPDIIFHLAAQSLVRRSYDEPLETWRTNVLGSVNLLESLKLLKNRCAVVIVTTDKVYENREWHYAYRESDPIGGHDPYSASKASVELALASWRSSFFKMSSSQVRLASARAGNVIGGGDWSKDRIVPDMIRYLNDETAIPVRNPNAMRPWQHVLEPLKGYLLLAQSLYKSDDIVLQSAFNFGPGSNSIRTVKNLVEEGLKHWPGRWDNLAEYDAPHEAKLLKLTSAKARSLLEWKPQWNFEQAVQYTIDWYRRSNQGELAIELMNEQIDDYLSK